MKLASVWLLAAPWAAISLPQALAAEPTHGGGRWALLIGIDDYVVADDLRFCSADQKALARQLINAGFADDHVFVMDASAGPARQPSRQNIERQLKLVTSLAEEGDVLLLAFSGHGVHLQGKSYLVPFDGDPEDPEQLISLDDVYAQLAQSPASFKLAIIDACRNDPRPGNRRALSDSKSAQEFARSLEPPQGTSMLVSCQAGQYSMEDDKLNHGVFMNYVLDGLRGKADANGDRKVTLGELARHAAEQTKVHVAQKYSALQVPELRGTLAIDALDFPLVESLLAYDPLKILEEALAAARLAGADSLRYVASSQHTLGDETAARNTFAEALAAARSLGDAKDQSDSLRYLAKEQAEKLGQETARPIFEEAINAARVISDDWDRIRRIVYVAEAQAELGDMTTARATLVRAKQAASQIQSADDRADRLNDVAEAQAKLKDLASARITWNEALASARRITNGNVFQQSALKDIAESQFVAGERAAARSAAAVALSLARAETNGVFKVYSLSAAAETYAVLEDLASAHSIYLEALQAAQSPAVAAVRSNMLKVPDSALGGIAKVQAKRGDTRGAYQRLQYARDSTDYSIQRAYAALAEAQARKGDISGALATARWLKIDYSREETIDAIFKLQLENGNLAGALNTIAELPEDSWRHRSAKQAVAEAQLKQGDVLGALNLARSIQRTSAGVSLLCTIARALAEKGEAADAASLVSEAMAHARAIADTKERGSAMASVASALAQLGRVDEALATARSLELMESRSTALRSIAHVIHSANNKTREVAQGEPQ